MDIPRVLVHSRGLSVMNLEIVKQSIEEKMSHAQVATPVINAFLKSVERMAGGDTGLILEDSITPIESIPKLEDINQGSASAQLLKSLAIIKLNGGLGTSMGLDKAKSLIAVKGVDTFLDFIARQVLNLHQASQSSGTAFLLMNSFSTQSDTLQYLSNKYPELFHAGEIDFLQSKAPKLAPDTYLPVSWPDNPDLEWCPPGHGDIYASLQGRGLIKKLLNQGIRYLFVSNSDNLGATADPALLHYFAQSGLSFLMEVAERTEADNKGGHLTRRRQDNRLVLRESAQCPPTEISCFQDTQKHRYFNTNNLWIRLDHLSEKLENETQGLTLPLIRNIKPVDPKISTSPQVLQIETAMGAAIECFDNSGAILVPRSRFFSSKNNSRPAGVKIGCMPDHRGPSPYLVSRLQRTHSRGCIGCEML